VNIYILRLTPSIYAPQTRLHRRPQVHSRWRPAGRRTGGQTNPI